VPIARISDVWRDTIEQAAAARAAAGKAAAEVAAQKKVLLDKALVPWFDVLFFCDTWTIAWWRGEGGGAWREQ